MSTRIAFAVLASVAALTLTGCKAGEDLVLPNQSSADSEVIFA